MPKVKQPQTIILAGGGSGGHITPLLSLAHALKKLEPSCRVVYIGFKDDDFSRALKDRLAVFDETHYVTAGKLRRYYNQGLVGHLTDVRSWLLNARDFGRFLKGTLVSLRLLGKLKPQVVFCKGGFVSVPVGIAAYLRRIPVVTHDSDAAAGLANRIVGRFAQVHATGLPANYYSYPKESVRYVGVPVDERIKPVTPKMQADFKKKLDLNPQDKLLLIGGAGHGARDVNNMVVSIAPALLEQLPDLHIIHLSGSQHEQAVRQAYHDALGELSSKVKVIDFTADFYKYTGAADLIITRAGATTIAELAVQRKAVILIPAPHLTGGHQLKNAEILRREAAVEVVKNNDNTGLLKAAVRLLNSQDKRRKLGDRLSHMSPPDAARQLAKLLLDI